MSLPVAAILALAAPSARADDYQLGHGLDIEHQSIHAAGRRMSTATATIKPASSVSVTCPSPMPSSSRTLAPRAE